MVILIYGAKVHIEHFNELSVFSCFVANLCPNWKLLALVYILIESESLCPN